MSKWTNPSADVLPEGGVSELNPEGSRVGMFSLRREHYFNEAGFDATERCLFDAGITEEANTKAATGCDQAELKQAVGPLVCAIASDTDAA